jgi:hypothetical protein
MRWVFVSKNLVFEAKRFCVKAVVSFSNQYWNNTTNYGELELRSLTGSVVVTVAGIYPANDCPRPH